MALPSFTFVPSSFATRSSYLGREKFLDSEDVPFQDSEDIGDEEVKKGPYQHFKNAISSLEEVQTFLASCGHSEILRV